MKAAKRKIPQISRLDRLRRALKDAEARAEFAHYLVPTQARTAARELRELQVELAYAERARGRKK